MTSGEKSSLPDTEALHRRAIEEFGRRVERVEHDQWTNSTPCTAWDVRTLVGHLVYENLWFIALVRGATIPEVGDRFEGDNLGDDPRGAWRRAAAEALDVAGENGALDRTVHLASGPTTAAEYAWEVLMDHTIHAWDLARGIDDDPTLDATLVEAVQRWLPPHIDRLRASGGFADPVEPPENPSAQDRLLAMLGRQP